MLEKANSWEYNKDIGPDIQRILGDVVLRHDSTYLYCDSAYLNEIQNNVRAYGNVHIRVSDTLNLFGDSLKYDGNTRIACIKNKVRLIDNETTLTTDTLYFDRNTDIARYDDWGKIVNGKNTLVSKYGYYYTDDKKFFFKQKVILLNPEYIMHSDTLLYNTVSETSYFFGPSTIVGKEDSIYCENGWYDTKNDISRFRKNGIIFHGPQSVTGDSMHYERNTGYGQVFRHAILKDTVKNIILKGNYGEIFRKKGYTYMTDSAVAVLIDKKDSLFLHSDTIHGTFDSTDNIRNIRAFYKVKFFRHDLQGLGDSLAYHGADSTMFLYHDPVIWSSENQLTADSIRLNIRNNQADSIVLYNSAFIISKDDTNKFNQVKGRNMIGYFKNNEIYKIRVLGNSETIYFAREDDRSLIGINKAISSDLLIFLEKNKFTDITYISKPDATFYPEKDISPYDLKLKNFRWIEKRRPLIKEDIFIW
ncbi:MAG: OstA-like protein [Bacteroidota bacterium]|nr:OstA-like protein [Bacteroidota bacterium]